MLQAAGANAQAVGVQTNRQFLARLMKDTAFARRRPRHQSLIERQRTLLPEPQAASAATGAGLAFRRAVRRGLAQPARNRQAKPPPSKGWHLLDHPASGNPHHRLVLRGAGCATACVCRTGRHRTSPTTHAPITKRRLAPRLGDLADDYDAVRILLQHLDVDVQAAKGRHRRHAGSARPMAAAAPRFRPSRHASHAGRGHRRTWTRFAKPCLMWPTLCGPARLAAALQDGEGDNKLLALLKRKSCRLMRTCWTSGAWPICC